jgi:crotonobetainyl-CoA:carnitine CoA-transferase CaiB-like acyl-CoA transferase
MRQILEGVRLVEVADWGFVPSAATVLGDWGADVVKVEHPVRGDPIRGLITAGIIPGASGRNFFVEHLGRNKRSIGVDLNVEAGREVLCRLVERADIFLTNFLPEARRRLRIDPADLRAHNPRLIYARGHGQGQRGPDAGRGGYDGVSFWARGAIADRLTPPGQPHVTQRPAFGDFIGGMFIAGGLAGALYHRERTGEALEVDVSLLGTATWVMSPDIVAAMMYGFDLPQSGMGAIPNALVGNYRCADGRHLVLMMLQETRFWPIFCRAVGREDLLRDPRFNPDAVRHQHTAELVGELRAMFEQRPRAAWAEVLNASECIWGPVQTPSEVAGDRQVVANRYVVAAERPGEDPVRVVSSPVQFDNGFVEVRSAAAEVGAHTEEVLLEAGYSWEDIAGLKAAQAIL